MSKCETVIFNGIKFRRYPESKHQHLRRYFYPSGNYQRRGIQALHIEIWKSVHGPVPSGSHIHHKNLDPLDNSLDNLECVTPTEHAREHFAEPDRLEKGREHINRIRPLAVLWHKSKEGREWHRQHGTKVFNDLPVRELVCGMCEQVFKTTKATDAKFCSNKCKSQWRRREGLDNVTKPCERCGADFVSNKYDKIRFCSKVCAGKVTAHFGAERRDGK